MKPSVAFLKFTKQEAARTSELSTGHVLLDRAFKIPLQSFLLIRSEPYAGATAILLELAEALTKAGKAVIYADVGNSVYTHRLNGIDKDLFYIIKPTAVDEIIDIAHRIKDKMPDPVFLFDSIAFLDLDWQLKKYIPDLAKRIRQILPEATVVCTQRRGKTDPIWTYVVDIDNIQNIYTPGPDGDNIWSGHVASLKGPHGSSKAYIDYGTGRVSKGYEFVYLEMEKGKAPNSTFEFDGLKVQGSNKFVHEYNKRLKDARKTSGPSDWSS